MRFLICFSLVLGFATHAFAQVDTSEAPALIPLENGYFLKVIPPEFITVSVPSAESQTQRTEWVTIPATYENVTKTEIVQEAFEDVKITPAVLAEDGSVIEYAKLALREVPAVTKQVSRRVVKTPARRVQRSLPALCGLNPTRRVLVTPEIYVVYDAAQTEIARFDNPADFLAAIETE